MECCKKGLSSAQVKLGIIHAIVLAPLTLFLCFYQLDAGANLGTGTGIDESWYIQVAQEMKQSGRWWLPTREGEPFFFKPPLNFWLTSVSSALFGDTIASFRYVGATYGVLFVILAYVVAAIQFASLNAGFFSALTLLSARGFLFINGVRFATLDAPVTFYAAVALVIMFRSVLRGSELGWRSQILRGVLVGVLLSAAVLTKSVLGYYVFGILGAWMLLYGNPFQRLLELRWFFGLAILISLVIPALWFVPHAVFTLGAFDRMVGYELISRFGNGLHNSSNTWLYWDAFKVGRYLPFYGSLAALVFCAGRAIVLRDRSIVFFILWAVVPFLTFSALSSRLVWYVAPCYFPAAILCGGLLGVLIDRGIATALESQRCFKKFAISLLSLGVVVACLWETGTYLLIGAKRVASGAPRLVIDEVVHGIKGLNASLPVIFYDAPSPATRERIFWNMLERPIQRASSHGEVLQAARSVDSFLVVTNPKHVASMMKELPVVGYRYLPPVTFPQGPQAIYRTEGAVVLLGSKAPVKTDQLSMCSRKIKMKLDSGDGSCEVVPASEGPTGPWWSSAGRGKPVFCEFPGDPVMGEVSSVLRLNVGRKSGGAESDIVALEVTVNGQRVALVDRFRERPQDYTFPLPAGVLGDRMNSVHLRLVSSAGEPLSPDVLVNNQFLVRWLVVDLVGG
jgi:4-amino-4-deoxy-L-arabinose transferase-like glycosyltransferase